MIKKTNLAIISFFTIYPLGAMPFVLVEVLNKKKYSIYLLSFFMAFLGYLIIPITTDDLIRHYDDYERLKLLDLKSFFLYLLLHADFLLSLFEYLLVKIGLSKQIIPFTSVFIGYFLKFSILLHWVKNYRIQEEESDNRTMFYLLVLITFCTINFRSFALNIRMPVSLTFLMYGLYQIFFQSKRKGWIIIALAVLTHIMTIIFIPLILIAQKVNRVSIFRILFILSFSFYLLPSSILSKSINMFQIGNEVIQKKQAEYTEGYWASEFMDDMSLKGKIARNIGLSFTFLIFLYLFVIHGHSQLRNLSYLTATLTNILFSLPTLYGRYASALSLVFFLLLLYEYNATIITSKGRKMLLAICLLSIMIWVSGIYSTRLQIIKSHPKMIYQSSFSVFINTVKEKDYIKK